MFCAARVKIINVHLEGCTRILATEMKADVESWFGFWLLRIHKPRTLSASTSLL
jgi:hypothetical protein